MSSRSSRRKGRRWYCNGRVRQSFLIHNQDCESSNEANQVIWHFYHICIFDIHMYMSGGVQRVHAKSSYTIQARSKHDHNLKYSPTESKSK